MKLSAKFAALFAAVLLLIVPTLAPAAQEQAQSLSPSLVSAGFETDKSSVAPGSTIKLAFKLKNTSAGIAVRNVNIRVSGGEALIVSQGSDSVWADTIAAGAVYSFSKSFYCSDSATGGTYPISLSASYEYFDAGEKLTGTAEINYSVRVTQSAVQQSLTPHIIISDFSYGDTVNGNDVFDLNFTLQNNSKSITVQNVIVKISGGEAFVPAEGTDTVSIEKISSTAKITQKLKCLAATPSGIYPVSVSVSYEYFDAGEKQSQSEELSLSIPVTQPERVEIGSLSLADTKVTAGEEQDCPFTVINSGKSTVYNGRVRLLDANENELAAAYIGNIEAGTQFQSNYTLPLTLNTQGMQSLTLVFEYENDAGEAKSVSRQFSVTAEQQEDPYAEFAQDTETVENYNGYWLYFAIAAVIAAILAVIVIAVVRKRKKAGKKGGEPYEEI